MQPTLSGGGVSTWTFAVAAGGTRRQYVFYGLTGASPTPAALSINFGAQTQNNCEWSVVEIDGCKLTGTNGADAIVQSKTATTASNALTFSATFNSAWGHADNRALAGFAFDGSSGTFVAGTGFTMLGQVHGSGSSAGLGIEHGRDVDLVVDMSITGTTGDPWRVIALEIAGLIGEAPVTSAQPPIRLRGLNSRVN